MINGISSLVIVAMFIEAFISYAKTIWDNKKLQWQIVLAFIIAAILCYNTGLNLFQVFGLQEKFPIIGTLATSLVMCRGSNYFFEFYNQLSTWRNAAGLAHENTSPTAFPDTTMPIIEKPEDEKPSDDIEQLDVKVNEK